MLNLIRKFTTRETHIFLLISLMMIMVAIAEFIFLNSYSTSHDPTLVSTVTIIDEPKDAVNLVILLISFAISISAFYISLRTFISIDGVNLISRMEGNILENEYYVTDIVDILNQYDDKDADKLQEKILNKITLKLKDDSKTAIKFADTLQYMIDVIIFFPAILHTEKSDSKKLSKKMQSIIDIAEHKIKMFHDISSGNIILLKESLNLFKGVITFQEFDNHNKYAFYSDLLKVRGSLLRNPVTKTVYHDYMGLYYHKKGMSKLLGAETPDQFSLEGIMKITEKIIILNNSKSSKAELEIITEYLEHALEQFNLALNNCKKDFMWPSFINFNIGITSFYLSLMNTNNDIGWVKILNNTIKTRSHLKRTIDDIFYNQKETLLQRSFYFEENLSKIVKINLLLIIMLNEKELLIDENYKKLIHDEVENSNIDALSRDTILDKEYQKLKTYKNQIINHLKV